GLGGGTGFGTLGACEPYAAYKVVDPLLISLQQSQATGAIRITSYNDDTYQGKMLDLNGDGIANKVSWIGKDTGVLFYDENNNGKLDGFNELLRDGVETENGETTQNGFDYVSKLLDTDGNKVFDSNDETFNQVKVLSLDENGDEVTQTLQELKIKSLDLNYQEVPLSNQYKYSKIQGESFVTQKSTYITEKGKVGQLVDVNLSYDTVNTQYTNNIKLTAEQEKVANLKGTGFVRDLNQATTQSQDLNKAIAEYAQCNTKDEQLEKLDDLAKAWAETSPYYTDKKTDIQAKEFYRSADTNASTINATKARIELEDLDNKINRFEKAAFETDETQNKLHILQQFYGQSDNAVYLEKPSDLGDVVDNIDKDYNALKQDMYENLLFQTRLNPYLQEISVNMDENNQKQFDFSGVENKFQQVYEENPEKALVDLGEFLHYSNIGELDPNLTKQFAKYYVQMGDNAEELIDKEVAKQIIFPDEKDVFADEEINHEINSSEIEILDSKISIDDFAITNNSVEENPQDFNDELAYAEYMPDWRYEEQDDKEPNDDWGMI
ncbi:MAG: hypothetical protein IJV35_00005, partial [Neisseriaceae bacterium]|nr:hypothetical protein [Neisseriaceae bacterium]